ncbi:helix-turn-helix transcriptional regulator [Candidatus Kaiserbacteria bacterium]|nr:helix-turn-helix transcriptional regulator [Candidatus Kaiserbacteria bacterium]
MQAQPKCPITTVATLLSDTWTILIVHNLIEGPKRFCELERSLDGISSRTLTLKLARLSREGMVKKTKDGVYTATEKGRGIRIIENAMRRYEAKYL